ncbi:MAG: hypothetical protein JNG84_12510 [Archangium sp.]|nr:hypothetical protein [Archangium sp.]
MSHPSFYALDAYALGGGAPELRHHVAACPQGSAHVRAMQLSLPMPPAVQSLRSSRPRTSGWLTRWAPAFAIALVAVVSGWALTRSVDALRAKGMPAAVVWLKREGVASLWNGQRVRAGDEIRLEVAPSGLGHLAVIDEPTGRVLYEAQVPSREPTLTPAWKLDDAATAERLCVVLSSAAPDVSTLRCGCTPSVDRWCARFVLEREPR